MDYANGIALALVGGSAALVGFDRDRAFYPNVLVVIASYCVWWPDFCLAYDLTAAIAVVWLLRHRTGLAKDLWQTGT